MKKIISIILFISIVLSFTGCRNNGSNVSYNSEDETDIRTTEADTACEENPTEQTDKVEKSEYGKNTGTDKTLTGLEPLALIDFSVKDPENTSGLSTEKIAHAYGVAKDEIPNDISVNSQKHFEDGDFNALTLDNISDEKVVYLTFDVGYDNGYTGMILDTLKDKNVHAAFFCTVGEMQSDPDSIVRMINEGHIVGNHTENHPSMDELSRTEMMKEIKAFDDYIRTNFGYSSPYFRFPKGEYSDCALDLVSSLGYMSVFWSLAYADWDINNQKGAAYAHDTVISRIHPGAVILLHAVSSDNANALGDIIDSARSMGYEFRSLEDYKV
ncbi:MAG: polysaccharide deacetylase family protein [Clostridia bacterium]|nr:polysaccharide deacetylase family protein [Clostridia bacterium]